MNFVATILGVLVLIATGVHAVVGAREFRYLNPVDKGKPKEVWIQTLCGWHWVSVDQCIAGSVLLVIGLSEAIGSEKLILWIISAYFAICGLTWLMTVSIIGRGLDRSLLILGQWIYCFIVSGLAFWAGSM